MNHTELQDRCKGRNFDQIVVVTKDIFKELANLQRILHVSPGHICIRNEATDPGVKVDGKEISYTERYASIFYENTELCLVQPVTGDTVYRRYLERFGEGICCVRERVSKKEWTGMMEHFSRKGLRIAQTVTSNTCEAAWIDLTDTLGILFELITEESAAVKPPFVVPARIAQINVTTPDVRKTIETIADLLQIGPWEVGCQNKSTVVDSGFRVDGELKDVDFEFLVAILVCGNIEWEAIQPVKGPLVYFDYLNSHGIGYHHILQEVPKKDWEDTLQDYGKHGVELSCKGKVGPVNWCYMDTESALGFFMELRTDAEMDRLPDGYLQYFYPEKNA